MALKAILDSLTDVPEALHGEYVERNGKFELQVEGMKTQGDVDRLQTALTKERNDHKASKDKFAPLAGFEINDVLDRYNRHEELLAASSLAEGAELFHKAEAARKEAWASLVPAPNIKSAPEKVAARFTDTQFWQDQTDRCISCGACTYFCPTCYCFTITDEGEGLSEKGGRRLRSWDNCMSSLFTREASGHNPRMLKAFRMRNRVSHKYSTYPENWGAFSCSGCGRCISNCPVCVDIRAIVLAAIDDGSDDKKSTDK